MAAHEFDEAVRFPVPIGAWFSRERFDSVIVRQFVRYVIVGLASNAVLFLSYLLLTYLGLDPKLSMSMLYVVGVTQTFFFNRNWSFSCERRGKSLYVKYFSLYGAGYFLNLFVLWHLVDGLGYAHQWVQGVMTIVLALLLFLGQKFWVFRT